MGENIWNLSVYCAFMFFNQVMSSVIITPKKAIEIATM